MVEGEKVCKGRGRIWVNYYMYSCSAEGEENVGRGREGKRKRGREGGRERERERGRE